MKVWAKINVRPSESEHWKGFLAELTGRCGLPCEIGKATTRLGAVNDLLRQLGNPPTDRFKERARVNVR
jgi:hypothetical protein